MKTLLLIFMVTAFCSSPDAWMEFREIIYKKVQSDLSSTQIFVDSFGTKSYGVALSFEKKDIYLSLYEKRLQKFRHFRLCVEGKRFCENTNNKFFNLKKINKNSYKIFLNTLEKKQEEISFLISWMQKEIVFYPIIR